MIQLQGLTALLSTLNTRAVAVEAATFAATAEAAEVAQSAAERHLQLLSHAPRTPTPSAPGSPPATITGALSESLHIEGPAAIAGRALARLGPTSPYGRIQELGGTAGWGARLPARPYLGPALRDSREAIKFIYREAWAAALTRG